MITQEVGPDAELRRYLLLFRRRRGIIILTALIVVASAVGTSLLQTPIYQGQARVLIRQQPTDSLFEASGGQSATSQQSIQTEIELLRSEPVRAAVRQKLGSSPRFSVRQVGTTEVIEIATENSDPEQAAVIANAYATAYTDLRRKQAVDDLVAAGREIQARVASLQREIDSIAIPSPPAGRPSDPGPTQRRDALLEQQSELKQKVDELQLDAALRTGGAQIVTPASVPTSPIKPTTVKNALLALGVGLVFGIALAFLFEYLDDTIKGKDDLERATQGLATLGLIPTVPGWKERRRPVLVSLSDPKAAATESYRALRTSIQFMGLDRPLRTIQVTSPNAGEGKTTTIANLGVALAQTGQNVVIVSCDLRRPRVHEFFGMPNGMGFTSVLLGEVPVSSATQRIDGVEGLTVVVSGPIPPNPSELLAGRRAVEALAALQAEADVVLIDCPPILPVTDAAVLANRVDGTLLVAAAGKTTRRELHRAQEVLRQVDARLIGTVLNGVSGDAAYSYSYGYQYAYAAPEPNGRKGRHTPAKI